MDLPIGPSSSLPRMPHQGTGQ